MGKYKTSHSPHSPDRFSRDNTPEYSSDEDTSSSISSSGKRIRGDRTSLPCAILNCKRKGTRLFTSLRGHFETKENHSNRCCEGCYRRDLRKFKKTHPDPFKKNATESFKKSPDSYKKYGESNNYDFNHDIQSLKTSLDVSKQDISLDLSELSMHSNTTYGNETLKKSPFTPKGSNGFFAQNLHLPNSLELNFDTFDNKLKKGFQSSPMQVQSTPNNYKNVQRTTHNSQDFIQTYSGQVQNFRNRLTSKNTSFDKRSQHFLNDKLLKFCNIILKYEGLID